MEGMRNMGLKNCPECGKLFVENASGMCPECYREEEKAEAKVVAFLREKEKASVEEIHQATGVKERTIFRMIKKGRFVGIADISYGCENCGAPIREGRLCDDCNKNFMKQVKTMKQDEGKKQKELEAKNKGSGMYTKTM